jgi:hypothetical protein
MNNDSLGQLDRSLSHWRDIGLEQCLGKLYLNDYTANY